MAWVHVAEAGIVTVVFCRDREGPGEGVGAGAERVHRAVFKGDLDVDAGAAVVGDFISSACRCCWCRSRPSNRRRRTGPPRSGQVDAEEGSDSVQQFDELGERAGVVAIVGGSVLAHQR